MNRIINIGFILLLAISCDEILDRDISKSLVELKIPFDGYSSTDHEVTIWWDYVEGADQYELVVVSPDFAAPQKLVLDTLITENTLIISFPTGKYQCCLKGINPSFKTKEVCHLFEIIN